MGRRLILGIALFFVASCADPGPVPTPDTGTICRSHIACNDGEFCNGAEMCAPANPNADANGCIAGNRPCSVTELCNEVAMTCDVDCRMPDADDDGVRALLCGGLDCDDTNPERFPGNTEDCDANDVDEDCDEDTFGSRDRDGDGHIDALCCNDAIAGGQNCGLDCGDSRYDQQPGRVETCDRIDNDCDGRVDEGVAFQGYVDADHDLHGDPTRPTVACPGEPGFSFVGDDCDDTRASVHGAQVEICDGLDNDCDDAMDESTFLVTWYPDTDGDGFGDTRGVTVVACTPPADHVLIGGDCDDTSSDVNPIATEICNGLDDDCDGVTDFNVAGDFEDDDGDGFADTSCGQDDCDDANAMTYPGATEICDDEDNDCDGSVDEGATPVDWYVDADNDGYGDSGMLAVSACIRPAGRVARAGDCDDDDPARHPGVQDICDGVDADCDGQTDENDPGTVYYLDADGDGFGDVATSVVACAAPNGYSPTPGDCDDGDPARFPNAPPRCTEPATDDDCDASTDEDAGTIWYVDADEDGVGTGDPTTCSPPATFALVDGDCDDTDGAETPGKVELCGDGKDNDCNGTADDCSVTRPVSLGTSHDATFTVLAAGDLRVWGRGAWGVLGLGTQNDATTPVPGSPVPPPLAAVDGGANHACGRTADGQVWCWGQRGAGQLGTTIGQAYTTPVQAAITGALRVSAGDTHTCVVTTDQHLYCFGGNRYGELGLGSVDEDTHATPARVPGLENVSDVVASRYHTCVLIGTEVRCFGFNAAGECGTGQLSTEPVLTPTPVAGLSGVAALARSSTAAHECVVTTARGVACWGSSYSFGAHGASISLPVAAAIVRADNQEPLDQIEAVFTSQFLSCAIRAISGTDREVWCWGANDFGQLGLGTTDTEPHRQATRVLDVGNVPVTDARTLALGDEHVCMIREDDSVWCWGRGTNGQTGLGTSNPTTYPAEVLPAP